MLPFKSFRGAGYSAGSISWHSCCTRALAVGHLGLCWHTGLANTESFLSRPGSMFHNKTCCSWEALSRKAEWAWWGRLMLFQVRDEGMQEEELKRRKDCCLETIYFSAIRVTSCFFLVCFSFIWFTKKSSILILLLWFYPSLKLQSQSTKQKGAADKDDKGNDNDGKWQQRRECKKTRIRKTKMKKWTNDKYTVGNDKEAMTNSNCTNSIKSVPLLSSSAAQQNEYICMKKLQRSLQTLIYKHQWCEQSFRTFSASLIRVSQWELEHGFLHSQNSRTQQWLLNVWGADDVRLSNQTLHLTAHWLHHHK